MEKMIKEKEDSLNMAILPPDSIPISQLPSRWTTTSSTQTMSVEQVTMTLENMSLQSKEIETLHDQLKALEVQKAKTDVTQVTKM